MSYLLREFDRVRGLDRNALLDRNQTHKDDTKMPLVLTYHPAFHRVYGILQTCLNALFVDTERQQLFKGKIFVSFRRAKNFKDTLVRAKVYQPNCQICALIVEGETFRNLNDSRSFTISSGAYHCNSENVVYLLQCDCCNKKKMWAGSTKTKFRQRFNVYESYFRTYARKYNEGSLGRGKAVKIFLGIFSVKAIRVFIQLA